MSEEILGITLVLLLIVILFAVTVQNISIKSGGGEEEVNCSDPVEFRWDKCTTEEERNELIEEYQNSSVDNHSEVRKVVFAENGKYWAEGENETFYVYNQDFSLNRTLDTSNCNIISLNDMTNEELEELAEIWNISKSKIKARYGDEDD